MAIAVEHCPDMKPPPVVRGRHCRLNSVAQLDRLRLDQDHQERTGNAHAGLSPRRRCLSSPCFTTVPPAHDVDHAEPAPDKKMPRVEIVAGRHARGVHDLITEAASAIASGTRLVPAQNGLGGALLLEDGRSGEHVAVIKPLDDAPTSPTHSGCASKAMLREVAAFLLDHDGFARVEPTALIKISRPAMPTTMASIQRFAAHEYDAGELGPSRFSVASVHRIGILDVRLLNIDRHAGNILVKKPPISECGGGGNNTSTQLDLIPIDHGLCLPEQLEDPYFEWLHWPQSSLPFSAAELEYVASLDPFKDAEMLRGELPSLKEAAIRILTLCTIFLQRAAAAGLCLADIGDMMTREYSAREGLSALDALCKKAYDDSTDEPPPPPCKKSHDVSDDEGTQFAMDFDDDAPPTTGAPHLLLGQEDATKATAFSSLAKSVSFSAAAARGRGGRKLLSFKELSGEEWAAFLERFEQLLPAAIEAKKRDGLTLTRLGTSF